MRHGRQQKNTRFCRILNKGHHIRVLNPTHVRFLGIHLTFTVCCRQCEPVKQHYTCVYWWPYTFTSTWWLITYANHWILNSSIDLCGCVIASRASVLVGLTQINNLGHLHVCGPDRLSIGSEPRWPSDSPHGLSRQKTWSVKQTHSSETKQKHNIQHWWLYNLAHCYNIITRGSIYVRFPAKAHKRCVIWSYWDQSGRIWLVNAALQC